VSSATDPVKTAVFAPSKAHHDAPERHAVDAVLHLDADAFAARQLDEKAVRALVRGGHVPLSNW
jgi:hypothetical protein